MNNYELTYLTSVAVNDKLNHISQIEKIIKESNGTIITIKKPERINIAYPIKKNTVANITTIEISVAPDEIKTVEDKIKLNKDILRYLLIRKLGNVKKKKRRERNEVKSEEIKDSTSVKETKEEPDNLKVSKSTKMKLEDIGKKLDEML